VGCLLTSSKGLRQGRQYTFEQPELHIGRTPENDLVLQDTGGSRQHVRISERLGRMLDFKRNIQFKDRKRAATSLANVKTHFPTAAHRCHNLAVEKANEYGL
jgi:hypothetical protein